ncbi:tRNA-2-methylthio-N(6)-dimethylallyladenosine synthase [uncultured archaeon]|nr:tRNA-2-methylthio-N(6)-dimethylallyladenosine synthase [uncultured archaeon]
MDQDLDFLFVFPNTPYGYYRGFTYNIGAARMIWNLRQNAHAAEQYCPQAFYTFAETARDMLARHPRYVGFSCFDVHFPLIADIAAKLKQQSKDVKIVVGGPTAMFSDEVILTHYPQIDLCVRGEGEQTVLDLVEGVPLNQIAGLSYIADGKFRRNPDRGAMNEEELNRFPSVYAPGLIPLEYSPQVGILTSTGCFYRCTYCHFSVLSGARIRFFSDDHVLDEIERIAHYWSTADCEDITIPILDEAFTVNKKRTLRLCRAIEEMQLPISFTCGTRGDYIDEEILAALAAARVEALFFGLESGSPKILRNVRKAMVKGTEDAEYRAERSFIASIRKNVKLAREAGFGVSVSAIFGLPGETENEARQTLEVIKDLGVPYMHNILQVYRGTQLWQEKEQYGIQTKNFNRRWQIPHETIAAYDLTKVPILSGQDRVFSNMRRNEIQAVFAAFVGPESCEDTIPSPVLMRDTRQSPWKSDFLHQHYKLGSRLVLCDMGAPGEARWLDDFIYPTSLPVLLSSSVDRTHGGMILRREWPLLNKAELGHAIWLTNVAALFSFDEEQARLVFKASAQTETMIANIIIVGQPDLPLLYKVARAITTRQPISCVYSPELLVTMVADIAAVTCSGYPDDDRICLGAKDECVARAALLFPELQPLSADELSAPGIKEAIDLLNNAVKIVRLLSAAENRPLEKGSTIALQPQGQRVLGIYQAYALLYNPRQGVLKLLSG